MSKALEVILNHLTKKRAPQNERKLLVMQEHIRLLLTQSPISITILLFLIERQMNLNPKYTNTGTFVHKLDLKPCILSTKTFSSAVTTLLFEIYTLSMVIYAS